MKVKKGIAFLLVLLISAQLFVNSLTAEDMDAPSYEGESTSSEDSGGSDESDSGSDSSDSSDSSGSSDSQSSESSESYDFTTSDLSQITEPVTFDPSIFTSGDSANTSITIRPDSGYKVVDAQSDKVTLIRVKKDTYKLIVPRGGGVKINTLISKISDNIIGGGGSLQRLFL